MTPEAVTVSQVIEVFLILGQFVAAYFFFIAFVHCLNYTLSLPNGPMRFIFSRLAGGTGLFFLMALVWVFEDMYPGLDTITDVLNSLALVVMVWGFLGLLRLRLNVNG